LLDHIVTQQWEMGSLLEHIVATITSDHIATIPVDTFFGVDTIVAFVISLVTLLTSPPVMLREE
jgi:hypothetical protein